MTLHESIARTSRGEAEESMGVFVQKRTVTTYRAECDCGVIFTAQGGVGASDVARQLLDHIFKEKNK